MRCMTETGSVIDGKYEILKEIGRGGMSVVYLAMDQRLDKQWAVKEIRKKGNGKSDEIVASSLLAEANMMKRLDHPAFPRIVDIIDNEITSYIVMDYIEGESLDKILKEHGAQTEELVTGWAVQLCNALSYLHSQNPPVIYRDMKPANVMLKPEGNIKIIDFGIAREYKEQNPADTTVLGTKGYAPPEQHSGRTDPRSDIFALGMTMHHLLTGIDPRNGEPYASVRQWNPELSEGIEIIIDRCVEPAPENRYQNCADLLYDLEHPEFITRDFKKKQKRKLAAFFTAAALAVVMGLSGAVLNAAATRVNNRDYDANVASSDPERYFSAVEIYPDRTEAYESLILYYKNHDASNEQIARVGNAIENHADDLDISEPAVADLYYNMGKLYFSEYDGTFKSRAVSAQNYFKTAAESGADFDKKEIAECYDTICRFMMNQSTTSEHSLDDYTALFEEINIVMEMVDRASDREANYDKISFYYVAMLLINDQAEYMAGVGSAKEEALALMQQLSQKADAITSTLSYVNNLKDEINASYDDFVSNINSKYNEAEKRREQTGQTKNDF